MRGERLPEVSGPASPSVRRVAIFRSMPLPDLTPEEYAEIVRLVRSAIDGERYVLSPRVKRLKSILAKLDPAPSATVTPYPALRPSAEPSFLLRQAERRPPAALIRNGAVAKSRWRGSLNVTAV